MHVLQVVQRSMKAQYDLDGRQFLQLSEEYSEENLGQGVKGSLLVIVGDEWEETDLYHRRCIQNWHTLHIMHADDALLRDVDSFDSPSLREILSFFEPIQGYCMC